MKLETYKLVKSGPYFAPYYMRVPIYPNKTDQPIVFIVQKNRFTLHVQGQGYKKISADTWVKMENDTFFVTIDMLSYTVKGTGARKYRPYISYIMEQYEKAMDDPDYGCEILMASYELGGNENGMEKSGKRYPKR